MSLEDHPWLVEFYQRQQAALDAHDDVALLGAAWILTTKVAAAVLERMGERVEDAGSPLEWLQRAREIEPERRHVFDLSRGPVSPSIELPNLHVAAYWVTRALRAKPPGTLPEEAPYRAAEVLTGAVGDSAYQLISAMTPKDEPVPDVDLATGFSIMQEEVKRDRRVGESMASVVGRLSGLLPSPQWERLSALDCEGEVQNRRGFLIELVETERPRFDVKGFWFGLMKPIREGLTTLDTYVFGASNYDPDDPAWPETLDWEPRSPDLNSRVLEEVYGLGHRSGSLAQGSDVVGLAYTCLLARELTRAYANHVGHPVGACAGFDGGDWIHLGWQE
ncbi:MAG: hypothetical protein M3280_00955 [Actinomycetota bacterium]|nr:hypothetical protein [Actinomycetota bacterium]